MSYVGNAAADQLVTSADLDPSFVVPVSKGGTGTTTLTGVLKGNGTGALSVAQSGVDFNTVGGQSILGNGNIPTNPPVVVTSSTSFTASVNTHYVLTGTATTVTLPAGSGLNVGDMVWITVANSLTTNVVAPNAADQINGTTAGTSMTIDNSYATVQLRWTGSSTDWRLV